MKEGLVLTLACLVSVSTAAGDGPFPAGTSSTTLEGLRCTVVMPPDWDPAKELSLVVALHGNGGNDSGMAGSLAFLAEREFVVVAPKSTALGWDAKDVAAVRRIAADLKKRLHVGAERLHALGFSNGGWNLAPVAFDEDLKFTTATWVAAGFKGGTVPKHAKRGMGALALAGDKDGNRDAAERTPDLLEGKVRSALCRIQPGKGHEWPDGLMPFYGWWLEAQEGRFVPGECLAFDWEENLESAKAKAAAAKTGCFAYVYFPGMAADPLARAVQNEVLLDPLVQRFGTQIPACKADWAGRGGFGVKAAPAVVVFDSKGAVVKTLEGKALTAAALAQALRSVAPDKTVPK